jgi:hypothetical protein
LRTAIDQHHARAALALAAAELGAVQAQLAAQNRQQMGLGVTVKAHSLLVDMKHR